MQETGLRPERWRLAGWPGVRLAAGLPANVANLAGSEARRLRASRRDASAPFHSLGKLGEYSTAFMNSGNVPRQKRRKWGSSAKVMTWPFPYGSLTR